MPKTIYAERKCLNPTCPQITFIPNRVDAKYCDRVCRSNHHFNLRKEENKLKYHAIQQQKQADKKLKEIYLVCQQRKVEFVSSEILEHHLIDLNLAPETGIDQKTKKRIYWFFEFGVLGVEFNKFTIVKKSQYGKL